MSHNTLMAYPTEFMEGAQLLYDHVSGGETTRNTAIHGAYQIVGYGLGKFVPDEDSGSHSKGAKSTKDEDTSEYIECSDDNKCCKEVTEKEGLAALKKCCEGMKGTKSVPGVPGSLSFLDSELLKSILAFALQKLQEWLLKPT